MNYITVRYRIHISIWSVYDEYFCFKILMKRSSLNLTLLDVELDCLLFFDSFVTLYKNFTLWKQSIIHTEFNRSQCKSSSKYFTELLNTQNVIISLYFLLFRTRGHRDWTGGDSHGLFQSWILHQHGP